MRGASDLNDRQARRIVEIIETEQGRPVGGLRVGVWGLTSKAGAQNLRDSPELRIVEDLVARCACVTAFDPTIKEGSDVAPCRIAASPLEAADCDVMVVLTEWPQFRSIDAGLLVTKVRTGLIVDARNFLDGEALAAAGLRHRIGGRQFAEEPTAPPRVNMA